MIRTSSSLAAFTLTLIACGGGGGTDPMPGPDAGESGLTLSLATPRLPILQGADATVAVTVTRAPGVSGPIEISQTGMPAGVTLDPVTVTGDTATLTLHAAASAAHTLPTAVTIRATAGGAQTSQPLTVTVHGPPGSRDTSFAGGIMPAGASDDYAFATAVQADGKILLAGRSSERGGDFAIVRLTRDGELDTTFGTGGRVMTDLGASETANAIAVQADGKIVVAGSSANDFAIVRYAADGTVDAKRTIGLGADADTAYALAIAGDGKIVVGGASQRGTATGVDFALVRLNADFTVDDTFGAVITPVSANSAGDSIYALAIDAQGRIVAAGGEGDFKIVRYLANGTLDTTFNGSGKLANLFGSVLGAARAIAIAADGTIVVAGHAQHDFALARIAPNGTLASKTTTAISADNFDEAQGLAIEGDGKIVVGGWVWEGNSSSGNFALVRYTATGTLDPTFDGDGIVITSMASGTKPDQGMAIALQADERVPATRVIVAGFASTSNSDFAVTRYWR